VLIRYNCISKSGKENQAPLVWWKKRWRFYWI